MAIGGRGRFYPVEVVKIGQIKVSVQKLGLKQCCFFDRNMDHLTSEWPGTKNLKGCANFDMEHRKWEKSLFVAFRPIAKILDYYEGHTI